MIRILHQIFRTGIVTEPLPAAEEEIRVVGRRLEEAMVVENVDEMIFWWHDPRFYAIFQNWKVAMDNASIVSCSD